MNASGDRNTRRISPEHFSAGTDGYSFDVALDLARLSAQAYRSAPEFAGGLTEQADEAWVFDPQTDFVTDDKHSATLNVQSFNAWIVPQSAIIRQDGKTYLRTEEKGYFTEQIEVTVDRYDGGKAVLKKADNSGLKNGLTIKVFP